MKVGSVEVSAFCHATEDVSKVRESLLYLLGFPSYARIEVYEKTMKGHHGNTIRLIRYTAHGSDAQECARTLFSALGDQVFRLTDVADGSKVHLRLSKFQAYKRRIKLVNSGDCIKVVVGFNGYINRKTVRELLAEAGLTSK